MRKPLHKRWSRADWMALAVSLLLHAVLVALLIWGLPQWRQPPPASPPVVMGSEDLMAPKAHGTCANPVQSDLRFGCDAKSADRICCFNRHYAEHAGYWTSTDFLAEVDRAAETTYYDSVTGKPLFIAPRGRSFEAFEKESRSHGWPSFRDEEVVWENVRCLKDGEAVSVDGTHLGHNLPDRSGNRYCINLVSVAGSPVE